MVQEHVDNFGPVDLVVFIGVLGISVGVGIYYAITDRKAKDVDNYYFGDRNMSPIPVGLSISVTFVSAITIIGFPAETYFYGTVMFWFGGFIVVPYAVAGLYYIPLIHRIKVSSIYETTEFFVFLSTSEKIAWSLCGQGAYVDVRYLELRFHRHLRKCASVIAIFTMVIYMGMTIYIPGLALNAVTPLSLGWTIVLTSAICTFYTTLGGMKAVIWTDVLQTGTMAAGAFAGLIKVVLIVGGFSVIWPAAERGGRTNTWNFNPDPTIRYSVWTFLIGQSLGNCRLTCINQSISQRYLSCGTVKSARTAAFVSIFPTIILSSVAVLTGAAMYTYYEGCDPLSSGKIQKPDQMMPYLVLEIFQDTPGMAGLFVAAGFSGTLSTVSSGINALAAITLEDFVLVMKPKLSQTARVTISKGMVFGLGALVMCVAFIVSTLDATVMRVVFTLGGALEGPLLGVFTLGILFPWCTTLGASIGQVVGTIFSCWLAIGSLLYGQAANVRLPVSVDQCPVATTTVLLNNGTFISATDDYYSLTDNTTMASSAADWFTTPLQSLAGSMYTTEAPSEASPGSSLSTTFYAISFLYFVILSAFVTVVVGIVTSFIAGANKPSETDPLLFVPFIESKIFPEKVRKFFRFGVPPLSIQAESDKGYETSEEYKLMLTIDGKESVL